MSKSSKRRKRQARQKAEHQLLKQLASGLSLPSKRCLWVCFSWIWKSVCVIAVAVGLISGYYQVAAKVSISTTPSVNPQNPFEAAFIVRNESPTSIKNVRLAYSVNYIAVLGAFPKGPGELVFDKGFNVIGNNTIPDLPSMAKSEATSFAFPVLPPPNFAFIPHEFAFCDVIVRVTFRTPFEFWNRNSSFRFFTRRGQSGELAWFPKSIIEPIEHPPEITNRPLVRFVTDTNGVTIDYSYAPRPQ